MSLPSPILYDPSVHQHLLYQFAQIHIDSIVNDELDSNIPPPFKETSEGDPDARVVRYWLQRSREVEEDARFIVMQLLPDDEEVLGFVSFHMNRGDGAYHGIEKLLVKFEHRRQGIARRLMAALEEEAKRRDYRFLVCCSFLYKC